MMQMRMTPACEKANFNLVMVKDDNGCGKDDDDGEDHGNDDEDGYADDDHSFL